MPDTEANAERDRLLDEIEQLRAALETSTEDNTRLLTENTRLLSRITSHARELHAARDAFTAAEHRAGEIGSAGALALEQREQNEEELRVAFEELQVLAEELDFANSALRIANEDLDRRVTERTREVEQANAASRANEAAFRAVANLVPDLLWRSNSAGDATWFNNRWYGYSGFTEEESQGDGWLRALHPVDRPAARRAWIAAVSAGTAYVSEHRIRRKDSENRWFLARAEPIRDESGTVTAWFGAKTDVHDQKTALEALQRSETRFRTLVEGMPQLVWRAVDGGKWTWSSRQWSEFTGLSREASHGRGWLRALHPDDREAAEAAWVDAEQTGRLEMEARIFSKGEGRHRHFRIRANSAKGENGRNTEWLGTSTDVDDIVQLQERQNVLVAELQHRTRNLIAVVKSVASQTVRTSETLADFSAEFGHRLEALSRVQGLLSRSEAEPITIGALVRLELDALGHVDGADRRITVGGPDATLRNSTVQTLALAVHELATNARKYGALSGQNGNLSVAWQVSATGENKQLTLDWQETGIVHDENRKALGGGYGRQLIERALPYALSAETSYQLTDAQLRCTIKLPLGKKKQKE